MNKSKYVFAQLVEFLDNDKFRHLVGKYEENRIKYSDEMKERDIAIDIVKFLAVFLIINSHADVMYPKLQTLATGGAIGDCLFLFCSGFTLFLGGRNSGFGTYYKRRISRIYPSVFAAVAFIHIISGNPQIGWHELFCTKPFVMAIMIYYVLLYYIRKYAQENVPIIIGAVAIASLLVYLLWFPYKYEVGKKGLYGITTYYRWIPYFDAMLLGAYVGMKRKELKYRPMFDFIKLILCLTIFYGFQYTAKMYRPIAPWQIVTLFPLMGIVIYFYKCCHAQWLTKLYNTKLGNWLVMFVGGLCLESYLIQYSLFTDKINGIWPLNLLIIAVVILACSFLVRCVARIFSQSFRTEDYEWRKVFSWI